MPTQQGEVVRVLITALTNVVNQSDEGKWYSRIGSENFGSIEGDRLILQDGTNELDLDRVWLASRSDGTYDL